MGPGRDLDPGSAPSGICPVIVGTTAVGKTQLVVSLAQQFQLEVISLDSRQIYRGMRIGTAQPTAAEQAACVHHLIDFVSPARKYSAARFRRDFETVYHQIRARGNQPILVGGAGLYLTALREGLFELPGVSTEQTTHLRNELAALPDDEIRTRLAQLDPASFERIHPNDRYRSQRAVEICLLAGHPMSELMRQQSNQPSLDLAFPTVVLLRTPEETAERIGARTEAMLAAGWLQETEALLAEHGPEAPGLAAIGYREIIAHLQGTLPRDELFERIVVATRQYAKRQRTWFRHVDQVAAGAPDEPAVSEQLSALLQSSIENA